MATLTAEKISDFLIIPDRWPAYEDLKSRCSKKPAGYVGGTSIYCWLISGNITSDDTRMRVKIKDLLLFYREQQQKWYFFNGKGATDNPEDWYISMFDDDNINHYGLGYQYGKQVFEWIRNNIANRGDKPIEYEPVANATIDAWGRKDNYDIVNGEDVLFLTQNLYIDGYRKGCDRDRLYSDMKLNEKIGITMNRYVPYRYFANIGVEYNTNIVPPQETIFSIDTAIEDVVLLDRMEKLQATRTFCIDTDVNTAHGQYRFLQKYSQTPLTVFINPQTMQPYQPNAYEYYRENGQRITGNLAVIQKGSFYYKWSRSKAKENSSLGKQIIIDAKHYPGTYRLVGETYKRNRYGEDEHYQFEIPLCKLSADNRITLQASGEPTVFTMKLNALRRNDGVMMKLTSYDLIENTYPCGVQTSEIEQFNSPNPQFAAAPYQGDFDVDFTMNVNVTSPRDISCEILEDTHTGNIGLKKAENKVDNNEIEAVVNGDITTYSIDTTIKSISQYNELHLKPEQYDITIKGE